MSEIYTYDGMSILSFAKAGQPMSYPDIAPELNSLQAKVAELEDGIKFARKFDEIEKDMILGSLLQGVSLDTLKGEFEPTEVAG